MKRRDGLKVLAAAVLSGTLSLAGGPASAHRGHAGLTVVEIAADGQVTVVHRFYAHDIEPTLVSLAPQAQPSLDDPDAVAALEAHLAGRFRVDVDGARVTLTRASTRLAGDNVRLDFTGTTTPAPHQVRIDLDFFPGVFDDFEQQVNVRSGGVTRSLVFHSGDQAKVVEF